MKSSKLCKPAPFMLLALCVAIGGCGSSAVRKDSQELIKEGQYEAGIARLEEALREDPRDTELNIALAHGRQAAVEALLTQADSAFAGRAYAAYGGVYIAASLLWLWLAEGMRPDRFDMAGAALALVGAGVILAAPR